MHNLAGKVKESKGLAKKEKYIYWKITDSELLLIPQDPIQMSLSLWGFLWFLQAEFIIPSPVLQQPFVHTSMIAISHCTFIIYFTCLFVPL